MEKSRENNDHKNFLKEGVVDAISENHKKYLGTTVPEGYFEKSKAVILDKIKTEIKANPVKEKRQRVFWMRTELKYMAAASLVFIFGLAVWLQNATKKDAFPTTNFEMLSSNEDYLINAILVDAADFDAFVDATLINEILIKAEIFEGKMDALFLHSLFVQDSLLDNYTGDVFLETIIL